MDKNIQILFPNLVNWKSSIEFKKFRLILIFLTGVLLLQVQGTKSEEIFLKCIGKFEINRGALIKPDWETTYLTINLDGLQSTIDDKGIKRKGRTFIRRNSYTITNRDKRNRLKNIYKINATYGTYMVEFPQRNRTLIGICQKGRG